jgi:hypothetical protein
MLVEPRLQRSQSLFFAKTENNQRDGSRSELATGLVLDDKWDEPRMCRFLRDHGDVFVAGAVENQGSFYDRFDHIVLLTAPLHVLLARVTSRTNNSYGKTAQQQVEIESYIKTVEPILRRGASVELDANVQHPS